MIIRRAARFGTKLNLHQPFLAKAAQAIIIAYGEFYPELVKNHGTILDNLTREEIRFARTVESGTANLQGLLEGLQKSSEKVLDGQRAFALYATYGLPLEITRDIAREQDMDVDEAGFHIAMDEHRLASGGGKAMGRMGGEEVEFYGQVLKDLQENGKLGKDGVEYDPYVLMYVEGPILSLAVDGQSLLEAGAGDRVDVILPKTGFYIESGGQVSDTGVIGAKDGSWEIEVSGMRRPLAGVIVHMGEVIFGHPKPGDLANASVDVTRRHDIRRNHTATHLLHAALHQVLGENTRQAGSSVMPDRFRFDFNHPAAMTDEQVNQVEKLVNEAVAADYLVKPMVKSRQQAVAEGAMALFGEKYGDIVRTISIVSEPDPFLLTDGKKLPDGKLYSYELCGGTHLARTSDVGTFLIISEGSAAAGVRRIEAVTGRGAYELITKRFKSLKHASGLLKCSVDEVSQKVQILQDELAIARRQISALRSELALYNFNMRVDEALNIKGMTIIVLNLPSTDKETLGRLADKFREKYPKNGICVISTVSDEGQVIVMATITQDLIKKGLKAGDLVGYISRQLGAGGGGAPHLAFGGGKDATKLPEALASIRAWVEEKS
jgi:alanyl-tRNA synthetase